MSNVWGILNKDTVAVDCFFNIGKYRFFHNNNSSLRKNNFFQQVIYDFRIITSEDIDAVTVYNCVASIDGIKIINRLNKVVELISKYDNGLKYGSNYLFHDIRKEYVIFAHETELYDCANSIVFVGFTVFENEVEFTIKAFNQRRV